MIVAIDLYVHGHTLWDNCGPAGRYLTTGSSTKLSW